MFSPSLGNDTVCASHSQLQKLRKTRSNTTNIRHHDYSAWLGVKCYKQDTIIIGGKVGRNSKELVILLPKVERGNLQWYVSFLRMTPEFYITVVVTIILQATVPYCYNEYKGLCIKPAYFTRKYCFTFYSVCLFVCWTFIVC